MIVLEASEVFQKMPEKLQTLPERSYNNQHIMKKILFFLMISSLVSCQPKKPVDLLLYNGSIYTVNQNFDVAQAIVIKDGKIIDVGTNEQMQDYDAKEKI